MNKYICFLTGCNGFLGSKLVEVLFNKRWDVVGIGRSLKPRAGISKYLIKYINKDYGDIKEIDFNNITKKTSRYKRVALIHLAWSGIDGLSDFSIKHQFNNVNKTISLFNSAKRSGFDIFIFSGSMEELFAKEYLKINLKKGLFNRHIIHATAKKMARDALKLQAKSKMKTIITTNSHLMGDGDYRDSFLQVTLSKMLNQGSLEFTNGNQLFDVISVYDAAELYEIIAKKINKNQEIWIGTGKPRKLKDYVIEMSKITKCKKKLQFGVIRFNDVILTKKIFLKQLIIRKINYKIKMSFKDIVNSMIPFLKNEKYKTKMKSK
jgi:nucleoside-diphosphate-sugar epimerase